MDPEIPTDLDAAYAEREELAGKVNELMQRANLELPQWHQRIAFLNGWIAAQNGRLSVHD